MELSDYVRVLRKSWILIAVAALLGIGVATAFTLTRTPLYTSQSTLVLSTQAGETISEMQQGQSYTMERVATYSGLVTMPAVIQPVIDELRLDISSATLAHAVTASSPLNTGLISITVSDPDPQRAADIANALSVSLTDTVEKIETPAGEEDCPIRLSLVKEALPASAPSSPNLPLNLALGGLVGLALGVGIAVLREVLDTRVRTGDDLLQATHAPLVGTIPFDPSASEHPVALRADPLSGRSESFRVLRTNLQFLDTGAHRSFVITSSTHSEGKSNTAINLALALADADIRVALVDADLRKPKVADYLGLEGGAGLTDVLIGRADAAEVMQPWGEGRLHVLAAGRIPPNPSELLGSTRMEDLLRSLEQDFDAVLLDAPPLLPVADAAILARASGGALMVVKAGSTTRRNVAAATMALQNAGATLAGAVLSMVPTRGPDASAHDYGYGYGKPTASANASAGK
jgi:capsular exopolysaccharide synthesis family protein